MTQQATIQHLQTRLAANRNIIAFGLFGDHATDRADSWSQLDMLAISNSPTAWRTFLDPDYFVRVGRVYHADVQQAEHYITLYLVFEDFTRLQLVVVPQDRLRTVVQSGTCPWQSVNLLQMGDENIQRLLAETPRQDPPPSPDEQLARVQAIFHEVQEHAIASVVAIVRDDRLAAMAAVLGVLEGVMTVRKIWQVHRAKTIDADTGESRYYTGNNFVDTMPALDGDPRRLLQLIEWGLWEFSTTARNLFPEWDERTHTIMMAVSRARAALPAEE